MDKRNSGSSESRSSQPASTHHFSSLGLSKHISAAPTVMSPNKLLCEPRVNLQWERTTNFWERYISRIYNVSCQTTDNNCFDALKARATAGLLSWSWLVSNSYCGSGSVWFGSQDTKIVCVQRNAFIHCDKSLACFQNTGRTHAHLQYITGSD